MKQTALMLALTLAVGIVAAHAQPPAKGPRIGYLALKGRESVLETFRQGLRELGDIEGQNLAIEARFAEKGEQYPDLVTALVRLPVDIIVSGDTVALVAAKQATSTIPIVMVGAGDPVASGLVASLERPGGNVTGTTVLSPGVNRKQLELLKEVVPAASRVAVLLDAGHPLAAAFWQGLQEPAQALGIQLQRLEVRAAHEFDAAFEAATREQAHALLTASFPLLNANARRIVDLTAKSRLPAMHSRQEYVAAGGLMAYGVDSADDVRRAATYVDKILKGAKPADLPVEGPMKFELVINLKTAKALGLTMPQSILSQADEVIQ